MSNRGVGFVLSVGLALGAGCGGTKGSDGVGVVQVRSALTANGQRVIGFEDPHDDWTLQAPATGLPPLTASTIHTQGNFSLAVQAKGYVPIRSAAFAVTKPIAGPIMFDIQLPTTQANPSWYGAAQLYLDCHSLGVYNAYVGQKELTGSPLGQFVTETFNMPSYPGTKLTNGCQDLFFTIAINVPTNATGTYLLDNLRFGGSETVTPFLTCVGDLDASGSGSHRVALFGYDSSATSDVALPIGTQNEFLPDPADRAQPRLFHPGRHAEEAAISFGEEGLAWQLNGVTAPADLNALPCTTGQISSIRAMRQAQRTINVLRSIQDVQKRQFVSALVLNLQSAFSRAAAGTVGSEIERRIATYENRLDPTTRAFVATLGRGLPFIPTDVRAELLGTLVAFDPGNGLNPPLLEALGVNTSNVNARVRTNFCAQPDRDVTVGIFSSTIGDPDNGIGSVESLADPVITGLQRNTVSSPHPVLVSDHDTKESSGSSDEGNGFSSKGIPTALPCPCDATQGLLCSNELALTPRPPGPTDVCQAYPIVTQGQNFTLRGYNFWDAETAILELAPVDPGNGGTGSYTAHTTGIDTSGANLDCLPADSSHETHDTASFQAQVSPGFYRLRLFNQNGRFRLRGEPPDALGRTIHTCWKLPPPDTHTFPLPEPTTDLNCDPTAVAGTTCVADGAPCPASIWSVQPRALADCQGSFLDPPRCGETPAWIGSQPLIQAQPIVYVQQGVPTFQVQVLRQSVEAVNESGTDFLGSDETQIILAGFTDANAKNGLNTIGELSQQAGVLGPDDYDSGTRRVFNPAGLLAQVNSVGQDDTIYFGLEFLEIDCSSCIEGVVGALGAVITGGLCAAGVSCAIAGPVGVIVTSAVIAMIASSDVNDNMGVTTWSGTPRQIADRISATHASNFLPNYQGYNLTPGALPTFTTNGVTTGTARQRLMHPFVIDGNLTRVVQAPQPQPGRDIPLVQCNPGTCTGGAICDVNQCVAPGSVDDLAGFGFREQRAILNGSDSWYGVDLLYERRQCVPGGTTPTSLQTVCQ